MSYKISKTERYQSTLDNILKDKVQIQRFKSLIEERIVKQSSSAVTITMAVSYFGYFWVNMLLTFPTIFFQN